MRILQVTNFFKPSWEAGGPVRSVYEISKRLIENGHDVTVYTTDGFKYRLNVRKNEPVLVDGIKTYYFRNISSHLSKTMNLPIPYYAPLILNKEIKNFEIIHINEYRSLLTVFVHYYAKKYKIPYILQPRGSIPLWSKSKQKKVFDLFIGQTIVRDANKIVASSKIESNQYIEVFPDLNTDKVIHIPNGIDLDTYSHLPKKGEFKKKYSIDSSKKVILFLSRIHERKGADILTEAFYQLKNDFQNVKLVFAGPDDGYLSTLRSIVKKYNLEDDVVFTGSLQGTDKLEAYVDADVFVLPSKDKYESFGNVIVEACASGIPIVITDNCGASEWIGSNCGCVVEADARILKDSILSLLTNEDTSKILGENGRRSVLGNLSYDQIIKIYENLYKNLVDVDPSR
jgi:glycosyltransferase involved in cell wall biosynthesis